MSDLRAQDRAARRAAQTVFDRPLILQAGAGTGKTTTLVGRILAWSLGPGWEATAGRLAARPPSPLATSEGEPTEAIAAELLSRLVAITFTEAAAAEMARRTASELGQLAKSGVPPSWLDAAPLPEPAECALRARALLGSLDRLTVRTIHAFCRSLLADYALEAGLHPELEVDAEGTLLEEVVLEVVEDRLRAAYGHPGDPDLLHLAALGFGPGEVAETLLELARQGLPARALADDPFTPVALASLLHRLRERASALHSLVAPRLVGAKRVKNAQAIEGALADLLRRLEQLDRGADPLGADALDAVRGAIEELFPGNLASHLRKWCRELGDTEAGYLGEVAPQIAAASVRLTDLLDHLRCIDPGILGPAYRALHPLLQEIERTLRTRGIATFEALLTEAAALLARRPSVRARVRRGIDQLLVDEFQDTDRIQVDLLRWLALDGPREERPGLFLVGDPKQSIYGWRNADLRAYDGFVARVLAEGGTVLPLSENFRSVPAILDEVTRLIEPVMLERTGFQPPYERLLPCAAKEGSAGFRGSGLPASRGDGSAWAPVEHWISWRAGSDGAGAATPSSQATALEAQAIAADLRLLHDEQALPWGEIALLLRSTGDLDVYLEALRQRRIPFAVGRDKQYYRRREIIEAAAWVRTIVDPGDHLALVTVLRSATVGVPDAALIPLWSQGFPRRMTELQGSDPGALAALRTLIAAASGPLPTEVPGRDRIDGWPLNLIEAVETLAELRQSFLDEPADRFVERLRRRTLLEATEAARYLGAYRLANLERFFRQLLESLETRGGDPRALLRALRRSVAESREAGEGRPQEAGQDAVSVLTLHGAKGLDFGHVYLLQLHHRDPPRRGGTAFGRIEGEGLEDGTERFEVRLFGVPSLGFDRVEAERREVEVNERVRTLYVGMTRAKERLVLVGSWPASTEALPVERAATYLDLLRPRGSGFGGPAALWEERTGDPEASGKGWWHEDETGALWKLPALRIEAETPEVEAAPGSASERGGEEEAEREALRRTRDLAQDRRRAQARMARKFRGTASEEAHGRLRELQSAQQSGDPDEAGGEDPGQGTANTVRAETEMSPERRIALAAGGAFHRALEMWELAAEPQAEAERQRALLPAYLAPLISGELASRALQPAHELLDAFQSGPLFERWLGLRGAILARELPLVTAPSEGPDAPVGAVAGTIDLLYRDDAGRLVVADYKTDFTLSPEALAQRAQAYAPQGAVYTQALHAALDLPQEPRFELWFVRAGRVVDPLSPEG